MKNIDSNHIKNNCINIFLYIRDTNFDHMKNDYIDIFLYIKDTNFDYMRNNYINTFLYMRDMNFEYMKDELGIYLRDFCINNELFIEIENIFSEYYDDIIIDISCA